MSCCSLPGLGDSLILSIYDLIRAIIKDDQYKTQSTLHVKVKRGQILCNNFSFKKSMVKFRIKELVSDSTMKKIDKENFEKIQHLIISYGILTQ